jgi:hypothetical protein
MHVLRLRCLQYEQPQQQFAAPTLPLDQKRSPFGDVGRRCLRLAARRRGDNHLGLADY